MNSSPPIVNGRKSAGEGGRGVVSFLSFGFGKLKFQILICSKFRGQHDDGPHTEYPGKGSNDVRPSGMTERKNNE